MRLHLRATVASAAMATIGVMVAPAAIADQSATTPSGDLVTTISGPTTILTGVLTTYTLTVSNPTSGTEFGVLVGTTVPNPLNFGTLANPDLCGRSSKPLIDGTGINCNLGDIPAGQSASVSYTATAPSAGLYTQSVTSSGYVGGQRTGQFGELLTGGVFERNAVSIGWQVAPGPTDLQVTGSASTGSPQLGAAFSYVFQVKNNGPHGAYDVAFDDVLPASLTATTATSDAGSCTVTGNAVHCALGLFAVGGQAKITVGVVAPTVTGAIADTATASMSNPDRNPANNSVTVTVQPK
jgi:uncharacterized repeat protein (TIGR01451 family)